MAYTVNQLSKLSGVTVRALHFYEEAGILKPAYYGSNGYRYYEQKELLQLQQILFFKELGFTLKQIQKVLGKSDFDQLAALYSHRQALSRQWEKTGQLLKTIDQTIKHLKGEKKMKDKEIFSGMATLTRAKESESYFVAEGLMLASIKNFSTEKREKSYYEHVTKVTTDIFGKLVQCIEKGLDPASLEVQKLVERHHAFAEETYTATKLVYKAMAQVFEEHPAFVKQLDAFHPRLAKFIAKAMKIFADRKL